MKPFSVQNFAIPTLHGISETTTNEHLKLYAGYVKNANLIIEHIEEYAKDSAKFAYELGELQRRFAFEFGGIRNHEFYFASFIGGAAPLQTESKLAEAINAQWISFDAFLARFKAIALTRGIGWAKLVYDPASKQLLTVWVDEQHLGQLPDTKTILALDMWEHSFVADYLPSGKATYVEDFFKNLNWSVIENNYTDAIK